MTGILKNLTADKPLMVVIDTSVFLHKIDQSLQVEHTDPNFKSAISAQLVWLLAGEWLGQYRGQLVKMVFALDIKDSNRRYWRNDWLLELENVIDVPRKKKVLQKLTEDALEILAIVPKDRTVEQDERLEEARGKLAIHYKAGRKLPAYRFTKLKKITYQLLEEMGAHTLGSVGYEADDCIASLKVVNEQRDNPWYILDLTVDADHLQLVTENFGWVCMSGYSPVVRDHLEVINEWCLRRLKVKLEHPTDIVAVKGDKGDASDALPPSNGVLIPVIDLLEPPFKYRYWLRAAEKLGGYFSSTEEPRFNQDAAAAAKRYLQQLGCRPIVRYLPGEDPDYQEYTIDYENQTVNTSNPF